MTTSFSGGRVATTSSAATAMTSSTPASGSRGRRKSSRRSTPSTVTWGSTRSASRPAPRRPGRTAAATRSASWSTAVPTATSSSTRTAVQEHGRDPAPGRTPIRRRDDRRLRGRGARRRRGKDTLCGGLGVDTVDYSDSTSPVHVTLDGDMPTDQDLAIQLIADPDESPDRSEGAVPARAPRLPSVHPRQRFPCAGLCNPAANCAWAGCVR